MGVGNLTLTSYLLGTNDISAGIGSIELNLIGTYDEYRILANKGIGSIKLDGNSIDSDTYYGTGNNQINIDGGVGSIDIHFKGGVYQ